jgi:hypothetical protein
MAAVQNLYSPLCFMVITDETYDTVFEDRRYNTCIAINSACTVFMCIKIHSDRLKLLVHV